MIRRIRNFFHWILTTFRYRGLFGAVWQLIRRTFRPFGNLECVTFLQRDLTLPLGEAKARGSLTITLAAESDIDPLIRLMAGRFRNLEKEKMGETKDLILRRFQKGSLCFLGKIGEEIIHYNWVSFNREESLGGRFMNLREDQAYCLDAYTQEKWRGQGVYPVAHYRMLDYLRQRGIRKAFTLIDTDNRPSKKIHALHGWKAFGAVLCFTPKGTSQGWVWRIKGNLDHFLEKAIPD